MSKAMKRYALRLSRQAIAAGTRIGAFIASLRADPTARERTLAVTVFAAIFAFALGSVDYLITGGPDWNPGGMGQAYAMEAPHPRYLAPQTVLAPAPEAPVLMETVVIEEEDYSIATEELLGGPDAMNYADAAFTNVSGKGGAAATAETLMSISIGAGSSSLKGVSAFETASPW